MAYYIGIDIGGSAIKYGVVDGEGNIVKQEKVETVFDKEEILNLICEIKKKFSSSYIISGVGISVPGFVTRDGYLKTAGAVPSLAGLNLKEELEKRLQLPVYVENDANCAALAENWAGNGKNSKNSIMITVGTGIGGAIIINDQLVRGASDRAGEFGFMILDSIVLEDTKSPSFSKVAAIPSLYHYYFLQSNSHVEDGKEIFDRASRKELFAQKAIANFIKKLSVGIYNIMLSFDPEKVIIGGAISANTVFLEELKEAINELFLGHDELINVTPPTIVPAKFLNSAGIIGSVYGICKNIKKEV